MPASDKTYTYNADTGSATAKVGGMRDPITLVDMDVDPTIGGTGLQPLSPDIFALMWPERVRRQMRGGS